MGALSLPADALVGWALEHRGYSLKQLTAIVMAAGAASGSLKKKEQQELISALGDIAAERA